MAVKHNLLNLGMVASKAQLFRDDFFGTYSDFDTRLRFVKFVYLFQAITGISLGFEFVWHRRGPYSVDVNFAGFDLAAQVSDYSSHFEKYEHQFSDGHSEKKANAFCKAIRKHINDSDKMEILASLEYLRQGGETREKELLHSVQRVKPKYKNRPEFLEKCLKDLRILRQAVHA